MSLLDHIPKIIHQTWRGNLLPPPIARCVESVRAKNPGWRWCYYNDDQAIEVIERLARAPGHFDRPTVREFLSIPSGVERSDVFRCAALYIFGGIYCDVDIEAIKSFDELLKALPDGPGLEAELLLTTDHPIHRDKLYGREILMNHFMAARPGARFFEEYFKRIAANIRGGLIGSNPVDTTGPSFLTNLVMWHGGCNRLKISVIPSEWINPLPDMALHYDEVRMYDPIIRDGSWRSLLNPFLVHYWWHSYCHSTSIFSIYGDSIFSMSGACSLLDS